MASKMKWPAASQQLCQLLGNIQHPILNSPMAQIQLGPKLAIAVNKGGGLGGIPCALLSAQQVERSVSEFRAALGQNAPLNLNFFAHKTPVVPSPEESPNEAARQTMERLERWRQKLTPYYRELGVPLPELPIKIDSLRKPFDDEQCSLVEKLKPKVISFHFGLPESKLFDRIKATGATVLCSATTVEEARWLEQHGVK